MSIIAERYVKALFPVAESKGALDAVDADLTRVRAAFDIDEVREAVLSPNMKVDVRRSALQKILGSGAHEVTKNLIEVVLDRRREAILADLAPAFQALLRESRGMVLGMVETAKPLDQDSLAALEARAAKLVGKNVTLEVKVVPELIGGVRIRVGNTLYDGSVSTALADLERQLTELAI